MDKPQPSTLSERLLAFANAHILEHLDDSEDKRASVTRDANILRDIASQVKLLENSRPGLEVIPVPSTVRLMEWLEKLREEATVDGSIPTLHKDVHAYGIHLACAADLERQELNEALAACQSEANGRLGVLEGHFREVRRLARIALNQPNLSSTKSVRGVDQFQLGKDGLLRAIIDRCTQAIGEIVEWPRL